MPDTSRQTEPDLWNDRARESWQRALDGYAETVQRQGSERLPELDRWVRDELPDRIRARAAPHITLEELEQVTRWKMSRGVWRGRNLALVRSNPEDEVRQVSGEALGKIPDPRAPITILSRLKGVGPATASAVAAAAAPEHYPFFDDIAAAQVPDLGPVAYTGAYYQRYANALRAKAAEIGDDWTPVNVERALWAHAGGKVSRGPSASD